MGDNLLTPRLNAASSAKGFANESRDASPSPAHGADPHFKLNQELRTRERIGSAGQVENYREYRKVFMESQLALLRAGGILLVSGPNRLFPFDFQHGDHYYHGILKIFDHLPLLKHATLPWHRDNHLVSCRDVQKIVAALPYKVEFLHESQADYRSMTKIRNQCPAEGYLSCVYQYRLGAAVCNSPVRGDAYGFICRLLQA